MFFFFFYKILLLGFLVICTTHNYKLDFAGGSVPKIKTKEKKIFFRKKNKI